MIRHKDSLLLQDKKKELIFEPIHPLCKVLLFYKNKVVIDELIKINYGLVKIIDKAINLHGDMNRTNVSNIGIAIKHELTHYIDTNGNNYYKNYLLSIEKLIALLVLLKMNKCHYYDFHLNNFINLRKFVNNIVNESDSAKLGGIYEKYKFQHGMMAGL